jgi:hypothetical protein
MKFENIESDLSVLYKKARKSFEECIGNKDNEFLKSEVNIPLSHIVVVEKEINIVLPKMAFGEYTLEVCLLLFEGSKEIGKYSYIENDKKEMIDDSLVFY